MKNIKNSTLTACIALMLSLMLFTSCSDDDNSGSGAGSPVIESVKPSGYDEDGIILPFEPVTIGSPKSYYVIHGKGLLSTQKVYFNDYETYFKPTYVTDTDIVILIDEKTPYANVSNKLKVVTSLGTAIFDFVTAPPPPTINWFNSMNAAEGDIVTIGGKYFLDPIVKVGSQKAEIVSSTLTEIKFKMPANSFGKLVSVTNITNTAFSSMTVGSALYDDAIQGESDGHWTWNGNEFDTNYTLDENTPQGKAVMRIDFGGWSGADMKFTSRDVSMYKAFRVKIKSTSANPDAKLTFVFGGWAFQIQKPITPSWTTVEIPFSDIGNPTTFDQLTFQESGNFGGNIILMDEMGFVLK